MLQEAPAPYLLLGMTAEALEDKKLRFYKTAAIIIELSLLSF
jgi:hypothetical protein